MTDLYLRGSVDFPEHGQIIVLRNATVNTYHWSDLNPFTYTGALPLSTIRPLSFGAGVVDLQNNYGRGLIFSTTPTEFNSGRIQIRTSVAPVSGSLTAFGVWPTTAKDPERFYVESATQLSSSGGSAAVPWTRHSAIFAVGRGLNNFPKVTYVGVGAKIDGVPADAKHYLKMVQLEKAPLDGGEYPTEYSEARSVQTLVHPDRLNFSENPAFDVNLFHWRGDNDGAVLERVPEPFLPPGQSVGGWSGRETIPVGVEAEIKHDVVSLVIGRRYTASFHVYAPNRSNVDFKVIGGTILDSMDYSESTDNNRFGEKKKNSPYRRIWVLFEATDTEVTIVLRPTAIG